MVINFFEARSSCSFQIIIGSLESLLCEKKRDRVMVFKNFLLILLSILVAVTLPTTESKECGEVKVSGRGTAAQGKWPWVVALKLKASSNVLCGGTLISEKNVLSGEFLTFLLNRLNIKIIIDSSKLLSVF